MYLIYNYLIVVKSPIRLINYIITEFTNGKLLTYWAYEVTWKCERECTFRDGGGFSKAHM